MAVFLQHAFNVADLGWQRSKQLSRSTNRGKRSVGAG
jgi:hypothetical protein